MVRPAQTNANSIFISFLAPIKKPRQFSQQGLLLRRGRYSTGPASIAHGAQISPQGTDAGLTSRPPAKSAMRGYLETKSKPPHGLPSGASAASDGKCSRVKRGVNRLAFASIWRLLNTPPARGGNLHGRHRGAVMPLGVMPTTPGNLRAAKDAHAGLCAPAPVISP